MVRINAGIIHAGRFAPAHPPTRSLAGTPSPLRSRGRTRFARDSCGGLRPRAPPNALARGDPFPPLRSRGRTRFARDSCGGFAPAHPPARSLVGTPSPHAVRAGRISAIYGARWPRPATLGAWACQRRLVPKGISDGHARATLPVPGCRSHAARPYRLLQQEFADDADSHAGNGRQERDLVVGGTDTKTFTVNYTYDYTPASVTLKSMTSVATGAPRRRIPASACHSGR